MRWHSSQFTTRDSVALKADFHINGEYFYTCLQHGKQYFEKLVMASGNGKLPKSSLINNPSQMWRQSRRKVGNPSME